MSSENQIDYDAVLADLTARRDQLNAAIAAIQAITNVAPGTGSTLFAGERPGVVQSDSFFGMTVLDASKKYLAMMKKPQTASEIAKALQDGGYLFNTTTPVNTVTSVLFRDDAKEGEIVRIGRGQFALASWYSGRPKRKKQSDATEAEEVNEGAALNPPLRAVSISGPST